MVRNAVQVSLRLPVEVRQENERFIATCFLLDLYQEAPSKHDVLQRLTNAVQSQLYLHFKDRVFDSLLDVHGLKAQQELGGIEAGPYIDVSVILNTPKQAA